MAQSGAGTSPDAAMSASVVLCTPAPKERQRNFGCVIKMPRARLGWATVVHATAPARLDAGDQSGAYGLAAAGSPVKTTLQPVGACPQAHEPPSQLRSLLTRPAD